MAAGQSQSHASMRKGFILLFILIALIVFTQNLPLIVKQVSTGLSAKGLHSYGQRDITEAQQDSLRSAIAGLWAFDGVRSDSASNVLTDRIELKKNGILWQVQQLKLFLPSGDSAVITTIQQGFIAPFFWVNRGESTLLCEVQVLKRVRIIGRDTCYMRTEEKVKDVFKRDSSFFAPTMVPVWLLTADGTRFIWQGRSYRNWGTNDITKFFPAGAITLVDDIHLPQCPVRKNDRAALRELICGDVSKMKLAARRSDDVLNLMRLYYVPYCLKSALENPGYPGTFMTAKVLFSVALSSAGAVDRVSVDLQNIRSNKWERGQIENEIRQWRFQPLTTPAAPFSFSGEMSLAADSSNGMGGFAIRAMSPEGGK
jgi:hypothetical protein